MSETPANDALPASKAPAANGTLAVLGVLWSLLLIAAGVVALHDALADVDILGGTPWLDRTAVWLDARTPENWMVIAAGVLALVGLWLVVIAAMPRPRREISLKADTGVFLSSKSIRRIAASAAGDVPGVEIADTSATKSRVNVDVANWVGDAEGAKQAVTSEINERLSSLTKPPRVRVSMRGPGAGA